MTRETTFLAVTPQMRITIATTIESLIALLDEIDGNPDDEPDLDGEAGTWPEGHIARVLDKGDDENLEDGADDEPSIGRDDREHDPAEMGEPDDGI